MNAKMAPQRQKPARAAVLLCCIVLLLCVCVVRVAGQRRYETVLRPEPDRPPDSQSATDGAATPDRSQDTSRTNRFGDSRGDSAADGRVGPSYDPENKRYGGANRNPYRGDGYRNRFSPGVFNTDQNDRKVEGVGILAGWRDDLQGQRRPEAAFLNPYIEVQTRLGPVTGFIVQMYDEPKLPEELWPANLQLELQKHKLNVSTFLGIPYAQAPVEEGRFKVR